MLEMIVGAAGELKLGDPRDPATDIGPVIDAEAKAETRRPCRRHAAAPFATIRYAGEAPSTGHFRRAAHHRTGRRRRGSTSEVFGPVLHVVRWKAGGLDCADRSDRRDRLRPDARHPQPHRRDRRGDRRRAAGRQRLRQSQHDRRGRRHPAFRRLGALGHRARRRAGRTISAASRWSRSFRSTPRPPAATPR